MNRYFEWISKETEICKIFQDYYNKKNNFLTYLQKRENKQASIDFLGRSYNPESKQTIKELAIEVRTLSKNYEDLLKLNDWFINFPISKLNELMKFWRMWKDIFIVYQFWESWVYFLNFDYYIKHNFEIKKVIIYKEEWYNKETYVILIPLRNFIKIWELK